MKNWKYPSISRETKQNNIEVSIGINHKEYSHITILNEENKRSLFSDFN